MGSARRSGPDPGDQLAGTEGLGQVVVGSELEAEQLVELVITRGEHHDGEVRVPPDLAGDIQPVQPRQTQVQDDQIRPVAPDAIEGRRSVGRGHDAKACVLKVVASELDDAWLVVDDEDGLHCLERYAAGTQTPDPPGPGVACWNARVTCPRQDRGAHSPRSRGAGDAGARTAPRGMSIHRARDWRPIVPDPASRGPGRPTRGPG